MTGLELGILLNLGFAPDPKTNLVVPIGEIRGFKMPEMWKQALKFAMMKPIPDEVSLESADPRFAAETAATDLKPIEKTDKNTGETFKQSNFFKSEKSKIPNR